MIQDLFPEAPSLHFERCALGYELPAGSTLFREGEPARCVFVIDLGVIELQHRWEGRDMFGGFRSQRGALGLTEAVLHIPYYHTAIALTVARLRQIKMRDLEEGCVGDPSACAWVRTALAREAFQETRHLSAVATGLCRTRLEHLFVELLLACGEEREDGSRRVRLNLTVSHLADLLLVSRERLSRLLSFMATENVLVRDRGWFVAPATSPLVLALKNRLGCPPVKWE
jgi:CRP-like cAMP-binding protein